MTLEELEQWTAEFEAFHQRFAPFFCRREPREEARSYLRGLLSPVRRKNTWQMAEALGEGGPQRLQRLLHHARWDADGVQAELRAFLRDEFGDPEGIAVLDSTSFVKKGTRSVGVKRQWCSTLGKRENCQVGVFLAYVSPRAKVFLDRRLYLPEEWAHDPERRAAAHVPEGVTFQTQGALAQDMLEAAWQQGVPMRWVTGDEAFGDLPYLRRRIAAEGLCYVLAVAANTHVWAARPLVAAPRRATGGRPQRHARVAPGEPPSQEVATLVAAWPESRWQQLSAGDGEKGPRLYDWAAVRVVLREEKLPGDAVWLLARRSLHRPREIAYYLSNAPEDTPLSALVRVAGARWSIESGFEEAKGETGLDEYEVRYWHSWHRHITLSLMAHSFLTWIRSRTRKAEAEKKVGARVAGRPGGAERSRGAQAARSGAAAAPAVPRGTPRLVSLAACPAPTCPAQPLSAFAPSSAR
jgi:SRSO17 transposase